MLKFKWCVLAAVLASVVLVLAGCAKKSEPTVAVLNETNRKRAVTVADPQKAVDEIYASLKEYKAEKLTGSGLKELLGIGAADVKEYYGQVSEAEEGLADVIIILPSDDERGDVQLALSKYKEQRMSRFENYDILDAYSIAQNAVIYDQGGYIILLMLADNDGARAIIDEYIPL